MEIDPSWFDEAAVPPSTRAVAAEVERRLATMPPVHLLEPAVVRQARESGEGIWGPLSRSGLATTETIPGPAGELPVRLFVPEDVTGVYLHLHGGGWVLGGAHHHDDLLERLAHEARVAVVSVGYRLAPEDPYPAAVDDAEAAARWLIGQAAPRFGTDRLLIGGESAGAHLSVLTLLRLRDRHGFLGFTAANLTYGCYDLSMTPSAARWGERNLVLSGPIMRWFYDHFVPPERRRAPDVSPLYGDLRGLPPALFTVGTLDPLLDDTLFMAARWTAAGGRAELAVYPGAVHGFNGLPLADVQADLANERIADFLRAARPQPEEEIR